MFFDDLTEQELVKVENIGIQKKVIEGVPVLKEGVPGTSFFLILSGRVEVRKRMPSGKSQTIVLLGPGDLIGEVGFFGVEMRTASVVAVTECEVLEFRRDLFETLITSYPMIGMKAYRGMARELAQRLAQADQNLMEVIGWALGQSKKNQEAK